MEVSFRNKFNKIDFFLLLVVTNLHYAKFFFLFHKIL